MAKALKSLFVRRRPRQHLQEPPSPEREESFELLDRCPDKRWKRTLKANHQKLRHEIRVKHVLPEFHSFLTDVEYERVQGSDKADNVDQVDQLVGILLTKEKREFEEFLVVLWQEGYADSAARLAEEAGVVLNTSSGMATAVDRDVLLAARAGIPKYEKDAMNEKNMLYYPLIEPLHDVFYERVIIPFESFVLESTDVEFQRFMRICEKVIRRREHPIACKVRLPTQRLQFLHDLQHKYGLWKDALEYQLLREVIREFRDEGLTLKLKQYEVLLREKGNTILMQCQREFRKCPDLCLKLKADHNTALSTLRRLKSFLVNDVGLKDASFAGFREGCIELFFQISSESASTALEPLSSHAFRSKLHSMGVRRVTLSGHWVINPDTGHVVFLQPPEGVEDHDTEDSTADVTQSPEMTASIAGHSGRLSDLEDVPSCKRVKLNPEEEDAPVFQPSHNIERQDALEDPYSSLLQSESSQSCLASEGVWAEETMKDGMCQPTKMTASDFSELGTSTVQVPKEGEEIVCGVPVLELMQPRSAMCLEEQRKLKLQLHAVQSVGSAKCSAAWRKRRRCRSAMSGTILLLRTGQQHATLPDVELTNEAMALTDPYSSVQCPNLGVDESVVSMSVSTFSQCNSEQMQNSSVENIAPTPEFLEEVLPVSKHGSTEQVQSFDNEGDKQSLTLEDEGLYTLRMQLNTGSQDVVLCFNNTQVGSDAQSEDNGSYI